MSEVKLLKYRVVGAATIELFEAKINALADAGYSFKDMMINPKTELMVGLMTISENDYSDVIQIKDVSPELADEAIRGGLEPVSMSLSTKFIRMVRRKKIGSM